MLLEFESFKIYAILHNVEEIDDSGYKRNKYDFLMKIGSRQARFMILGTYEDYQGTSKITEYDALRVILINYNSMKELVTFEDFQSKNSGDFENTETAKRSFVVRKVFFKNIEYLGLDDHVDQLLKKIEGEN